jgi:hypothetical protein
MSSVINMSRVKKALKHWLQGIGFASFLTILLVIAKLTHHLAWTWWWAFSPLWLSFAFTFTLPVVGALGVGLISFIAWLFGK